MNDSRWQIDYQCPQCGAPVILDETDCILSCPYCRTKLYLVKEDGFRYIIPHNESPDREIYYLPYWRVKGSHFSFLDRQVQFRFVDITQKAVPIPLIPQTIGVRPQAMKLKYLMPESPGFFLTPQGKALESVFPSGAPDEAGGADFIGEVTSLIYTPVYLEGKTLYDAVTKQRINDLPDPALMAHLPRTDPVKSAKIIFLSTLCPQCGWNLEGAKDALTLCCPHCHTLWQCRKDHLETLAFTIVASSVQPDLYLPFWRMKIAAGEFCLASVGDLIRLANLPKVATPELDATPLYFWSPAFKINPALYMRWTRLMTVSQPAVVKDSNSEWFPAPSLHPVTLPLSEAVEGVRMNIGQLLSDKRLLPTLAGTNITLLDAELVYQPFRQQNSELIHTTLGLTVDRNALSLAVHLS